METRSGDHALNTSVFDGRAAACGRPALRRQEVQELGHRPSPPSAAHPLLGNSLPRRNGLNRNSTVSAGKKVLNILLVNDCGDI